MYEDNNELIIVGILDTNFNHDRYDGLKEINPNYYIPADSMDNYAYWLMQSGAERIVYFKEGSAIKNPIFSSNIGIIAISLTGEYNNDKRILEYVNRTDNEMFAQNDIENALDQYIGEVLKLRYYILVLCFISLVFSFLVIFNYFSSSTTDEKNTINKLRLLGATKKDIIKIYYSRTLLIGVFLVILSSIITSLIVVSLNSFFTSFFLFKLTLFSFEIIPFGIILGICFITITSATIIPILIHAKKYPVKYITEF
jgi:ABC-type antimicrobial peptide transport system permease subunit